jgi:hypothetical protein
MDLQKTKIYLDKLNREFARMSKDPENIVRLDVDIMASYVRELYDAILSESSHSARAAEPAPTRKPAAPKPADPPAAPPPPAYEAPAPAPMYEPPAPPPPVIEETPAPAAPPVVAPVPAPVVASRSTPPAAIPPGIEILFEEKQAKELADKLSEQPITDLKKSIALNDRLLLTSELFAGDGQAFEKVISAINSCADYEEAKAYLVENCVVRYTWTDKKRLEAAKNFVKLVRRRFK